MKWADFYDVVAGHLELYLSHPPFAAFLVTSSNIDRGRIMTDYNLRLYQPEIVLHILDTNELLTDLTDSYLDTLVAKVRSC